MITVAAPPALQSRFFSPQASGWRCRLLSSRAPTTFSNRCLHARRPPLRDQPSQFFSFPTTKVDASACLKRLRDPLATIKSP